MNPPSEPRPPVAFLGLGALGTPMAARVLAAGFPLTVHNRTRSREESLSAAGAARASQPAEAVQAAELIALCLSDDAAVEAVLFGAQGVARGAAQGSLVVDFSTIAPRTSQAMAERLAGHGITYLDAPVTGGTEGARSGTLSVLVGGAAEDLERARPLLAVVGHRITHFGAVGSGQKVKAVNQVLVAGSYAAVAEGLALARRLELPLEEVCEALRTGAAGSWALEHRSGSMIAGRFPLGFRLALHRKDLAIALEAASRANLVLPISRQVAAIEDELLAAGYADEDVAALSRWFEADASDASDDWASIN